MDYGRYIYKLYFPIVEDNYFLFDVEDDLLIFVVYG